MDALVSACATTVLRFGIALVLTSFVCWLGVAAAPLVGHVSSARLAAVVAGGSFVAAEATFWVGVALMGRGAWAAAKRHGWRKVPRILWSMLLHGTGPADATSADAEGAPPGRGAAP